MDARKIFNTCRLINLKASTSLLQNYIHADLFESKKFLF